MGRTYTVEIQAGDGTGIWQAMHPAETVEADSAEDAARDTAHNQNITEGDDGGNWRVVAWDGADADTGTEPAAIYTES